MVNLESLGAKRDKTSYEGLSILSLDAAIELDRRRRESDGSLVAVNALAHNLKLNDDVGDAENLKRLVDPRTVDIYSRAVIQLTKKAAGTIEELAGQIRTYADAFKRDPNDLNEQDIDSMQKFCLALHGELLAEIHSRKVDRRADIA